MRSCSAGLTDGLSSLPVVPPFFPSFLGARGSCTRALVKRTAGGSLSLSAPSPSVRIIIIIINVVAMLVVGRHRVTATKSSFSDAQRSPLSLSLVGCLPAAGQRELYTRPRRVLRTHSERLSDSQADNDVAGDADGEINGIQSRKGVSSFHRATRIRLHRPAGVCDLRADARGAMHSARLGMHFQGTRRVAFSYLRCVRARARSRGVFLRRESRVSGSPARFEFLRARFTLDGGSMSWARVSNCLPFLSSLETYRK